MSGRTQKNWSFSLKQQIRWIINPESMFDAQNPHFINNGGAKEVNFVNRRKSKKETKFIEDYKHKLLLDAAMRDLEEILESPVKEEFVEATKQLEMELDELKNKYSLIKNSGLEDQDLTKKRIELLTKMNDLKEKLLDPLHIIAVKSKEISTIKADFSFNTGDFVLTKNGRLRVENILTNIYKDIDFWIKYLKDHNTVFREDVYVVRFFVKGYTDEQGYKRAKNQSDRIKLNKKLSDSRAYSVRSEIYKKFNKKYKNLSITLSIEYIGMGEELPPGVIYGPKDDKNRRICTIGALVGPKSSIKL